MFIGYRRYRVQEINNCTFSICGPWHEGLWTYQRPKTLNSLCLILTTRPTLDKRENKSPVVHTPTFLGDWQVGDPGREASALRRLLSRGGVCREHR